jgi:peptide subunit release factor RF-3
MDTLTDQLLRRLTFAIISHSDAGKTTLTEKIAAACAERSNWRARSGRVVAAALDWIEDVRVYRL